MFMSVLKRLSIRPTGVVSKNAIGHLSIQCRSFLCSTVDATAVATAKEKTCITLEIAVLKQSPGVCGMQ